MSIELFFLNHLLSRLNTLKVCIYLILVAKITSSEAALQICRSCI